jgi:molybdate transport repressor ModE-like protein
VLDPRHLRVLREVARTGSYSAAARALGYSQPAISQQMRALERAAGAVLTVRVGRSMRLTEAGEALVRHAAGILGGIAAAEEEVAAIAGLRAGRVRLVAFPSGSATLVPAALAAVTRAHPGVQVTLREAEPPESLALLRAGECDVVLAFTYDGDGDVLEGGPRSAGSATDGSATDGSPTDSRAGDDTAGLAVLPLLEDPMAAVLPAGHPLAAAPVLRLSALADQAWIAGCPRCRRHLVAAAADAGFTPRIGFATDDHVAVQGLVAAGLGVALMPGLALASHRHPGVVVRALEPPQVRTVIACTWPELRRVPAVAVLLAALGSAARNGA